MSSEHTSWEPRLGQIQWNPHCKQKQTIKHKRRAVLHWHFAYIPPMGRRGRL